MARPPITEIFFPSTMSMSKSRETRGFCSQLEFTATVRG
jgi:hypothetical protein